MRRNELHGSNSERSNRGCECEPCRAAGRTSLLTSAWRGVGCDPKAMEDLVADLAVMSA